MGGMTMAHVIVEIDGVRHKLINTKSPNVCATCSIEKECTNVIGSPCLGSKQHFVLDNRRNNGRKTVEKKI